MASVISASTTSGTALNMSADTTGVLQLATGATPTTAVTIDTSQNVGIGTTSPSYTSSGRICMTINGSTDSVWTMNYGGTVGLYAQASSSDGKLYTTGSLPLLFGTGSAERMRIDSSGNVGIGTASPAYKLDVSTDIRAGGSVIIGSNGTYVAGSIYSDTNWGMIFRSKQASPAQADFRWANSADTERMQINSSGSLILAGSTAQKASGTTWSNPSDQRLKDNIRDYTKGTTELMQVRVREWEYNGKGGTTEGLKGLGVVADEVMTVLPNTVETYDAKLNADDEETTEIKKFDATEITWLLVKTVQEQQTIINDLKARIETLEAK